MCYVDIQETDRFRVARELLIEEVDDESLLLDLEENHYFGLNPTARRIWDALGQGDPIATVVDTITGDSGGVSRSRVAEDVIALVMALLERNLIELDTTER